MSSTLTSEGMNTHNMSVANFQFSAVNIDQEIGSSEQTLVSIAIDVSSSVSSFKAELEKMLQTTVQACQLDPRADSLMLRIVSFASKNNMVEIHGFKPLNSINLDDYNDCLNVGGMTALYDGTISAIDSVNTYGEAMTKKDYDVNGLVVVITDGGNNDSVMGINSVKDAVANSKMDEKIESLATILVGVNTAHSGITQLLQEFEKDAPFDKYLDIANATPSEIAKLGGLISKSISLTSSSLGTGGPSQQISSLTI